MPIQTVDTDRLYRKIAQQLSDLIASGELAPGQRLPSERELAQQLGVSRPSLREALIALEIEGKVDVRVGSGIFVALPRRAIVLSPMEAGEGPFELIQARRVIEGEVAAIAAHESTPLDMSAIRAAFEEMRHRQQMGKDTDAADRAFHLALAAATHNSALGSVVLSLWDRARGAMWKQMEKHFQTRELRAATLRDHAAILRALKAGEPRRARAAMRGHIARVEQEFARGWEHLKDAHRKERFSRKTGTKNRSSSSARRGDT
jgi:DNA-binding FadR family transcriptional regulator